MAEGSSQRPALMLRPKRRRSLVEMATDAAAAAAAAVDRAPAGPGNSRSGASASRGSRNAAGMRAARGGGRGPGSGRGAGPRTVPKRVAALAGEPDSEAKSADSLYLCDAAAGDASKPKLKRLRRRKKGASGRRSQTFRSRAYSTGGALTPAVALHPPSLLRWVSAMVRIHGWDARLDTIDSVLATFSVVLYILFTTADTPYDEHSGWCFVAELIVFFFFILNTTVHLGITGLSVPQAAVEVLTILPIVAFLTDTSDWGVAVPVLHALHGCHHLRWYRSAMHLNTYEVRGQLIYITGIVLSLILAFAAIVIEAEGGEMDFFDAVYFIIVSVCTVGYGDVTVTTTEAKAAVLLMLVTGVIVFPIQTRRLLDLLNMYSVHQRRVYVHDSQHDHVILSGDIDAATLETFVGVRCWVNGGLVTDRVVVLRRGAPTHAINTILRNPAYSSFVVYLDGSPMVEADLARAGIATAKAVFLFAGNNDGNDADLTDASTIITALKVKRSRDVPLCMQLMRPENQAHAKLLSRRGDDASVCISTLKMRMLSKNVFCPGLSTMMANLVTPAPPPELRQGAPQWMHEYLDGAAQEVIICDVPDALKGLEFIELARFCFEAFEAIAFALVITPPNTTARVALNPGRFRIPAFNDIQTQMVLIGNPARVDLTRVAMRGDEELAAQPQQTPEPLHFNSPSARTAQVVANMSQSERTFTERTMSLQSSPSQSPPSGGSVNSLPSAARRVAYNRREKKSIKEDVDTNRIATADTVRAFALQFKMSTRARTIDEAYLTMSDARMLENHIIIAGQLHNLFHFILPLRSRKLASQATIVLLGAEPPDTVAWRELMFFPDVKWVRGSALVAEDLARAGLAAAARVFLFQSQRESTGTAADYAPIVFACQTIRANNRDVDIVADVPHAEAIDFLRPMDSTAAPAIEGHSLVTEQFASGQVFLSSIVDNLSALAVYTPQVMTVLQHMLETEKASQALLWDEKMKGVVDPVVESMLLVIPVPSTFRGGCYGDLVTHLTEQNIVPIGLMRGVIAKLQQGPAGNGMPFVFTNPPPEAPVYKCDSVFVLSQGRGQLAAFSMGHAQPSSGSVAGAHTASVLDDDNSSVTACNTYNSVESDAVMAKLDQVARSMALVERRLAAYEAGAGTGVVAAAVPRGLLEDTTRRNSRAQALEAEAAADVAAAAEALLGEMKENGELSSRGS